MLFGVGIEIGAIAHGDGQDAQASDRLETDAHAFAVMASTGQHNLNPEFVRASRDGHRRQFGIEPAPEVAAIAQ